MPSITINGRKLEFKPGQTILQIANAAGEEIPQYCYHDGLSVVASCRICLVECQVPNPKTGQLEAFMGGKLVPSCQQTAVDGMVVFSDSPKAVANQKAVMEYLLINHPLDCPVCDQSGECFLQDYSYLYGRGVSRFEEDKVKQPKKDVGPHVLLYADRCIMCTRCVRFTREVTGTAELMVQGRGNKEEIDVFPGVPLANELSANVIDLCPVGALLDKDFLFAQRVWFLKETASIDGLTASGDNLWVHHNQGRVYRIKPRENAAVNKWWITDEVRYGWKFVHSAGRLSTAGRKQYGAPVSCDYARAYGEVVKGVKAAVEGGKRLAVIVSPMLSCEDAWHLGRLARRMDPKAVLGVGPVPVRGQDKVYPIGAKETDPGAFKIHAEKAPNARGVRRVLKALGGEVVEFEDMLRVLGKGTGASNVGALIVTGNYPGEWVGADLEAAAGGKFLVVIDTLASSLTDRADVVLPGATWMEKSGTFENAKGMLQAFARAIPPLEGAKSEAQHALDIGAVLEGAALPDRRLESVVLETTRGQVAAGVQVSVAMGQEFCAAATRREMAAAGVPGMDGVLMPPEERQARSDMALVEL
jgi:NADH-quinone oxidoreductase subunit G